MSNPQPAANRIAEAFWAFMLERAGGNLEHTQQERAVFYESVKKLLDDHEPDAFLSLELDGSVWTIVVVDDGLRLLRFENDTSELRFLGPLRGSYNERLSFKQGDPPGVFRFEDDRLPGGFIEIALPPPRQPGDWPNDLDELRREPIAELRRRFRTWASTSHSGTQ